MASVKMSVKNGWRHALSAVAINNCREAAATTAAAAAAVLLRTAKDAVLADCDESSELRIWPVSKDVHERPVATDNFQLSRQRVKTSSKRM